MVKESENSDGYIVNELLLKLRPHPVGLVVGAVGFDIELLSCIFYFGGLGVS